jgi:hypothetical protein
MNGLLLHSLDLQGLKFLIENLTLAQVSMMKLYTSRKRTYKIHNNTFVN